MKKYTVYGNCQAYALSCLLDSNECFKNQYEYIPIKAVFQLTENEVLTLSKNIFSDLDLFICQPIINYKECYQTEYIIRNILKKDCIKIIFPSLHFKLYYPQIVYLEDYVNKCKLKSSSDYHDINLLKQFNRGKVDIKSIKKIKSNETLEKNISELKSREVAYEGCHFIAVCDFIEQNYSNKLLFYTINHPTNVMLKYICEEIFKILDVKLFINLSIDPLKNFIEFPIYENIITQFNIESKPFYVIKGEKINFNKALEMDLKIYENICTINPYSNYIFFTNMKKRYVNGSNVFYNPDTYIENASLIIFQSKTFDIDLLMKLIKFKSNFFPENKIPCVAILYKNDINQSYIDLFDKFIVINHLYELKLNLYLLMNNINNGNNFNTSFWMKIYEIYNNVDIDTFEYTLFNFNHTIYRYGIIEKGLNINKDVKFIINNDNYYFKISDVIKNILEKYGVSVNNYNNIILGEFKIDANEVINIVDYIEEKLCNNKNTVYRHGLIENILNKNLFVKIINK